MRSRQSRRDRAAIGEISARFRNIASRYLPGGEIVTRSRRAKPVRGEITAISARFQNIAPRYLARSEIATRSRRDKLVCGEIVTISARIAAMSAISCRDFYCCNAETVSIFARFISIEPRYRQDFSHVLLLQLPLYLCKSPDPVPIVSNKRDHRFISRVSKNLK